MRRKRSVIIAAIAASLLMSFLQIGGNGVASVSFAAFSMLFAAVILKRGAAAFMRPTLLLCAALMMFSTLPFVWTPDWMSMILRVLREWFVLSVIICAARIKWRMVEDVRPIRRVIFLSQIFFVIVNSVQLIALKAGVGVYTFLPWEWYGAISGDELDEVRSTTLASYWLERGLEKGLVLGEELIVRPAAFFAEPSYYGFVAFSLYVAYCYCTESFEKRLRFFIITLMGLLLAQTLSGVLVLVAYSLVSERRVLLKRTKYVIFAILALVLSMPFYDGYARLFSIFDDTVEASGFSRLVKPFMNIYDIFEKGYFFGLNAIAFDRVLSVSGVAGAAGLDNGVLNVIQFYGLGGFVIFAVLGRHLGPSLFWYLLLCGVFNGTLFGFDKGFIFVCVSICYATRYGNSGIYSDSWSLKRFQK